VTIDGVDYGLAEPFFVAATQNPVEYEGTYPLPEAQLDRFLMKVLVNYPSEAEEEAVLRQAHRGFESHNLEAAGVRRVVTPAALALPVLRHRLLLRPEAELEGLTPDRVVENLLAATPVPR